MKFNLPSFLTCTALLSTFANAEIKMFTSDGVVYSYAVITSTISPPSVYVETMYYTTTRVKEITLANSQVTSTTENFIETSTFSTSTADAKQAVSTSDGSHNSDSRSTSTLQPSSTSPVVTVTSVSSSVASSTSGNDINQSSQQSSSRGVTSTLSPSSDRSTGSTENSPSGSSRTSNAKSLTSIASSASPYTTVTGTDGICSVYYDDDEYYSTVYLTDPSQSVDAATTITSTVTIYTTSTLL